MNEFSDNILTNLNVTSVPFLILTDVMYYLEKDDLINYCKKYVERFFDGTRNDDFKAHIGAGNHHVFKDDGDITVGGVKYGHVSLSGKNVTMMVKGNNIPYTHKTSLNKLADYDNEKIGEFTTVVADVSKHYYIYAVKNQSVDCGASEYTQFDIMLTTTKMTETKSFVENSGVVETVALPNYYCYDATEAKLMSNNGSLSTLLKYKNINGTLYGGLFYNAENATTYEITDKQYQFMLSSSLYNNINTVVVMGGELSTSKILEIASKLTAKTNYNLDLQFSLLVVSTIIDSAVTQQLQAIAIADKTSTKLSNAVKQQKVSLLSNQCNKYAPFIVCAILTMLIFGVTSYSCIKTIEVIPVVSAIVPIFVLLASVAVFYTFKATYAIFRWAYPRHGWYPFITHIAA